MNYRRGLQRVYAVLTVGWIAGVVALSVRDRPAVSVFDPSAFSVTPPPAPDGVTFVTQAGWPIVNETPSPGVRLRYWAIRLSAAVLPPTMIYLFLFYVAPWVYRGFRES